MLTNRNIRLFLWFLYHYKFRRLVNPMNKQRRTFHTVRIRFRAELLNYFPGLMITTNNHCTIHFRILKVCIIVITSITNRRRKEESDLLKERRLKRKGFSNQSRTRNCQKELEELLGLFPVLYIDITLSPSNRRRDNVLVVIMREKMNNTKVRG